jgi:hypothetical protein
VLRKHVDAIARELKKAGIVRDPARTKLVQTRKALVSHWMNIADSLDAQGEVVLAARSVNSLPACRRYLQTESGLRCRQSAICSLQRRERPRVPETRGRSTKK